MWVTDVVAKCRGFVAAYRGEARLAPCEYPGRDRSFLDGGFLQLSDFVVRAARRVTSKLSVGRRVRRQVCVCEIV